MGKTWFLTRASFSTARLTSLLLLVASCTVEPPPCPYGDMVDPGMCIRGEGLKELGPFATSTAAHMGGEYEGLTVEFEASHEDLPYECLSGLFRDEDMLVITLPQAFAHELGHVDVFNSGKQVDAPPTMTLQEAAVWQHSPAAGWTKDVQDRVSDTKSAVPPPWFGEVCKKEIK